MLAAAPIYALNSGPSLAPLAGKRYAKVETGADIVIVTDSGGTSYDVSLVRRGDIPWTAEATSDRLISVTRNRVKCNDRLGSPAVSPTATGSSTVFDDGVRTPRRFLVEVGAAVTGASGDAVVHNDQTSRRKSQAVLDRSSTAGSRLQGLSSILPFSREACAFHSRSINRRGASSRSTIVHLRHQRLPDGHKGATEASTERRADGTHPASKGGKRIHPTHPTLDARVLRGSQPL